MIDCDKLMERKDWGKVLNRKKKMREKTGVKSFHSFADAYAEHCDLRVQLNCCF